MKVADYILKILNSQERQKSWLADKVNTEGIDASKISPKDVKKIQKTRENRRTGFVKQKTSYLKG